MGVFQGAFKPANRSSALVGLYLAAARRIRGRHADGNDVGHGMQPTRLIRMPPLLAVAASENRSGLE